jgi:hypothetical protein
LAWSLTEFDQKKKGKTGVIKDRKTGNLLSATLNNWNSATGHVPSGMPTATTSTPPSPVPGKGHPAHDNHESPSEPPPLDTSVLKELARRSLVDALNSVSGPKTLVLDPAIAGPLGLVAEVSLMKVFEFKCINLFDTQRWNLATRCGKNVLAGTASLGSNHNEYRVLL